MCQTVPERLLLGTEQDRRVYLGRDSCQGTSRAPEPLRTLVLTPVETARCSVVLQIQVYAIRTRTTTALMPFPRPSGSSNRTGHQIERSNVSNRRSRQVYRERSARTLCALPAAESRASM